MASEEGPLQVVRLDELFATQVAAGSDRLALVAGRAQLSYGELDRRANRLAHTLRSLGVAAEDRVALAVGRGPQMIVGILGITKAGAAYVPLDPSYPRERLEFMLRDVRPQVLLTEERFLGNLGAFDGEVLCVDRDRQRIATAPESAVPCRAVADNLAYVIYTSGSTGLPKGTLVSHRGLGNLMREQAQAFHVGPGSRVLQFSSLSFDASTFEVVMALTHGATLVLGSKDELLPGPRLRSFLEQHGVGVVTLPPSALRALPDAELPTLRTITVAGEACPQEIVERWAPGRQFFNLYGPTEATIWSTMAELKAGGPAPHIGGPIAQTEAYVMVPSFFPVAVGEIGELYLGGVGLARGYWGRPGLTAERFLPHPSSAIPGTRLYRTGDRVCERLGGTGELDFLGRVDHQVKLRGFRVELGEVEALLEEHPAVEQAVALLLEVSDDDRRPDDRRPDDRRSDDQRLVAWVVVTPPRRAEFTRHLRRENLALQGILREHLSRRAPEFMVPSAFGFLDALPLMPSGKVDRGSLEEQGLPVLLRGAFEGPRTELEEQLTNLWQEVLGIDRIGIRESFLDLGGDSIRGARLVDQVQERLGQVVYLSALFEAPTIAELASYLKEHYPEAEAKFCGTDEEKAPGEDSVEFARVGTAEAERLRRLIVPLAPRPETSAISRNPPAVFLLAPPRSGSTIFRVMLGGHPRLFVPPELELLSYNTLQERRQVLSGRLEFLRQGAPRALMEVLDCGPEEAEAQMAALEEEGLTIRAFYRRLQEWLGDRLLVEKSTIYGQDTEVLHRAEADFEGALYIHLVRHPCAVIHSFNEARIDRIFRFPHSFSARQLGELLWQVSHENIERFLADVAPARHLQVSFEKLLEQPKEVLATVCSFLGIELHPDMLEPYRNQQHRMVDGLYAGSRTVGDYKLREHRKLDPAVAWRWRGRLDPATLGDAACQLAQGFGYADCGEAALSFPQQRLWFLDQLGAGAAYHSLHGFRLEGKLSRGALTAALGDIIRRQSGLRTSFPHGRGDDLSRPVQRVEGPFELALPVSDLTALAERAKGAEILRQAQESSTEPFNLAQGPLLRARLLSLEDDQHLLLLTFHHIVFDGRSLGIFLRELAAFYAARTEGREPQLPPLPAQVSDFARWQRRHLTEETLRSELTYWQGQLAGIPAVQLPADRPRSPNLGRHVSQRGHLNQHGGNRWISSSVEVEALESLARRDGVTTSMVLTAVFKTMLLRLVGQTDLSLGTPVAGRRHPEFEGLIGFFVNTLVLRTDLSGNPSFSEALGRVRRTALGAYDHQDLPFEKVVEALDPQRVTSRNPLFQVAFMVQESPWDEVEFPGLEIYPMETAAEAARVDLEVHVGWVKRTNTPQATLRSRFLYDSALFDATTIERWGNHFCHLLESVLIDPGKRLSALELLGAAERHELLVERNPWGLEQSPVESRRPPTERCFDELFTDWARKAPQRTALVWGNETTSYEDLDRRANRLAHTLEGHGIGPEDRVAFILDRGPWLITALLGVAKAGAGWVPLDPILPPERLRLILEDAQVKVVVTEAKNRADLPAGVFEVLCVDADQERIAAAPASPLAGRKHPASLAYMIYTSGSTGRPKGVMVSHRGFAVLAAAQRGALGVGPSSRVLQFSSPSFDASVFEVMMALAHGATLILGSRSELMPGPEFVAFLRRQAVSMVTLPPSALLAMPRADELADLTTVTVAGEACPAELVERFAPGRRFFNLYGPTEATIWSTSAELKAGGPPPHLGEPIVYSEFLLLDSHLNPVPLGISGEIFLGGAGLARGYHGRRGLTACSFIPHPWSKVPGARLYKTGDLVRRLPAGSLDFLGRADHQIKLRGFRIELGEIEALLGQHAEVERAVVRLLGVGDTARLVAYVVPRSWPENSRLQESLRTYLRRHLPEYMEPQHFSVLRTLPLLPSGKVDRKSLPEPSSLVQPAGDRVAPRGGTEAVLAELWADVLELPRLGVHDDFFELGGHSLLATRLISRIRDTLEREVSLQALFEHRSVAELAAHIEGTFVQRPVPPPLVARGGKEMEEAALSFSQERLWFLDQLEPGDVSFNIWAGHRLVGPLNVQALRSAFAEVVRRHGALRTTFPAISGVARQRVAPAVPSNLGVEPLSLIDLSWLGEAEQAETWQVLLREEGRRPFDLGGGPLLRTALVHLGAAEHILLLSVHHIVSDGWSMGVLYRELATLYGLFQGDDLPERHILGRHSLRSDSPGSLPPLAVHYTDYAQWQRQWLQGDVLERELAWWRQQLVDAPSALDLPLDRPRPAYPSARGASVWKDLSPRLAEDLRVLARREHSTLFMVLLAAFKILLMRLTGQQDLTLGTPVAGRDHSETEALIGFFLNTLVLRTDLSGDPSFRQLLQRVRRVALGAFDHQQVPFEQLLVALQPERNTNSSPFFQVFFNMVDLATARLELPGLEAEPLPRPEELAKLDLTLYVVEEEERLTLRLNYKTDLFDQVTIQRLIEQFHTVLEGVVEVPDRGIESLDFKTPQEKEMLSRAGDALSTSWKGAIHRHVAAWAARRPERLALRDDHNSWTYGELHGRANRLAHGLRAGGLARGGVVAIYGHRSAELVLAVLGVLGAGGAFSVLDPSYPPARLALAFDILQPQGWIALSRAGKVPAEAAAQVAELVPALCFTLPDEEAFEVFPDTDPGIEVGPEDIAVITFTSGSTGRPKGVAGRHGPLTHFMPWMARTFGLSALDRFVLLSALAHDPLQRDLFTPLQLGASLFIPDLEKLGGGRQLRCWMSEAQITVCHLTPSLGRLLTTPGEEPPDSREEPPKLRRAFFVGEALSGEHVNELRRWAPKVLCINLYGSTETQRAVGFYRISEREIAHSAADAAVRAFPLGEGMEDVRLLVLNRVGGVAAVGEPGEIYVRSPHLARGYLSDPVATAERFLPDPFAGETSEAGEQVGGRLYRTGDRGVRRADGAVVFRGRVDDQIKLRGLRIEPGEIESAALAHPGVGQAVVATRRRDGAEAMLVLYWVPSGAADDAQAAGLQRHLRHHLRRRLPEAMLPQALVVLDALPRTATGKIDRRALPEPEHLAGGETFVGPRTSLEESVCKVWQEVLGVEKVGIHDDFFELGGHSLLATQLVARLRSGLAAELPLRVLFEHRTVAELAERLAAPQPPALPPIPRGSGTSGPLSFPQQRLWFLDRLGVGAAYNLSGTRRLRGELAVAALAAGLSLVVARHGALRTRFPMAGGEPRQEVEPAATVPLPVVDLSLLDQVRSQAEARRLVAAEARLPFGLARGPLLRCRLLHLAKADHVLQVTMHHIVSDGWSEAIFLHELSEGYRAFLADRRPDLPSLEVQYVDFAVWQRQWLRGEKLEALLSPWRELRRDDSPTLDLPTDRPRHRSRRPRGAVQGFHIPAPLVAALETLGQRHEATSAMVFLAAFKALLHRLTGGTDIALGVPVANRSHHELESLIGFFVNTLVLRSNLQGNPTFVELLVRERGVALAAFEHQALPFERLVEALDPQRDLDRNPLFQVLFAVQNVRREALDLAEVEVEPFSTQAVSARFDLEVRLGEPAQGPSSKAADGEIVGRLIYDAGLFDATTMGRLADQFVTLLESTVAQPGGVLSELALLGLAQRQQVLVEWNDTAEALPQRSMHALVARQAAQTPEMEAVVFGDEQLSYGELIERAGCLAMALRARGLAREEVVGVCVQRSPAMVVAVLGVLMAGGAYLPLDPALPAARLLFMARDARIKILLTEEALVEQVPALAVLLEAQGHKALILPLPPVNREQGCRELEGGFDFDQLAYVMYTSGSTGRPKGVQVSHRNAVNLLTAVQDQPGLKAGETLLAVTTLSFDIALVDLFLPLLVGARLVLAPSRLGADGPELARLLAKSRATFLQATPVSWRLLLESGWHDAKDLTMVSTGEALPPDLAAGLLACGGRVWNLYGPTETTVWAAGRKLSSDQVTIGGPLANTRLWVVDRYLRAVPQGTVGELLIAGVGLARGYLGRPALTAERFIPDPFTGVGERLYRSGDLARWQPNGDLACLGRLDHQVKVRGHRIELGEIEAVALRYGRVEQAVAMVQALSKTGPRLVLYVVSQASGFDLKVLREHLNQHLPDSMVPQAFVILDAFPRTPSGKVDRASLPTPDEPAIDALSGSYVAPRDGREEILCMLWGTVLGSSRVGVHDDFFALGGHSLLATRVISRIRDTLGMDLPLRTLFERRTVAELARYLERSEEHGAQSRRPGLQPVSRPRKVLPAIGFGGGSEQHLQEVVDGGPLSFAQRRLWFLDRLGEGPAYNLTGARRFVGSLNEAALGAALGQVVARHEALRTSFGEDVGEPRQWISSVCEMPLPVIDLSALAGTRRWAEARRLVASEVERPFDLARGPLLRGGLLRLGLKEHVLLLAIHHVVSDGWSFGVFQRELSAFYQSFVAGEPARVPALPIQYADFAAWQHQWLKGELLEGQLNYWRRHLEPGPTELELPTDRPRRGSESGLAGRIDFCIPAVLRGALEALCTRHGATLAMTLTAALKTLVARHGGVLSRGGAARIAVGSPIANRTHSEVEPLIGFFVNTLVLCTDLAGNPSFGELVERERGVSLDAYEHQDLPFERLVEALPAAHSTRRDLGRNPLFQVLFAMHNGRREVLDLSGLVGHAFPVPPARPRFDLEMHLRPAADQGLDGWMIYDAALFDRTTIGRWAHHFECLLKAAAAASELRLLALPVMSHAERHQTVVGWNDTVGSLGSMRRRLSVMQRFGQQVKRDPGAVALTFEGSQMTYGSLAERADGLARTLRVRGIHRESRVGLCVERGLGAVVGILGILKAGAAYVPLDPSYPGERLAYMMSNAGCSLVVTEESLVSRLAQVDGDSRGPSMLCLDRNFGLLNEQPAIESGRAVTTTDLTADVMATQLAYVIYTSGSTGRPKGVAMPHGPLSTLVDWQIERSGSSAARTLHFAPLSFDVSFQEIFSTLGCGGTLVLVSEDTRQDPEALWRVLISEQVTRLFLPFVALGQLAEASGSVDPARSTLKEVITAGEALQITPALRACFEVLGCRLENQYGPAECHVVSAWRLSQSPSVWPFLPPIGRPILGARLHLLDSGGRPVPVGVVGELFLGGEVLSRGYLGAPASTASRYLPADLGCEHGGERLYRTGDLARVRSDGAVEFLGRVDQQVKVRGFRIEPGEIESLATELAGVEQAAASVRQVGVGRQLVLFVVVGSSSLRPEALREHLRLRLPEYMVPQRVVFLDALPLTPSGKVDRRGLEGLALGEDFSSTGLSAYYVAPRDGTEEVLCDLWMTMLARGRVGVHDDFFDLGGHSLLATQVVSRIRDTFGTEVPLRTVFEHPTVAQLAVQLGEQVARSPTLPPMPALIGGAGGAVEELSFAQQRLWFLDQLGSGTAYNIFGARCLLGGLNLAALGQSLAEIVARHGALRTCFPTVDGEPRQQVVAVAERAFELPLVDLSSLVGEEREEEALRLAARTSSKPFDLAKGPLLSCTLLRLGPKEHRLFVAMHHIISDGWSLGVFNRELALHYRSLVLGRRAELPELPAQYVDFAAWQRRWLQGEVLEAQLAYWSERLGGELPILELPTDRPRAAVKSYRGASYRFALPRELVTPLRPLAALHGSTLAMVLLAGFQALLFRHSQQRDLVVGLPIANRTRSEIEDLIGFFVNTLAIRVAIRRDLGRFGTPSFSQLLEQVREVSLGAYAHQDLPFEELVRVLQPERALSHSPLFQVLFQLMNAPMEAPELPGLEVLPVPQRLETSIFDLSLMLWETPAGLAGRWRYNPDLFDVTTVARLTTHFQVLLEGMVADPGCPLGSLPLLLAGERHQLCREWNDPVACLRPGTLAFKSTDTVLDAFDRWVKRSPQAEAVVFGGPGTDFPRQTLSYGELARRAGMVAQQLLQAGATRGHRVGLCVRRSLEMAVGLLGILRAGVAYVPLDPTLPTQRLNYMLEVSEATLILSQGCLVEELEDVFIGREVLLLDGETSHREADYGASDPGRIRPSLEDLAYVIFTSGSTGRPKGVAMSHGPLANLISWHLGTLLGGVRSLQFATLGFDGSFHEIFATWCSGGSLYLVPEDLPRDVVALRRLLEEAKIEKAKLPVVMLQQLAEEWHRAKSSGAHGGKLSLRELTVSGSQLTVTPAVAAFCAHHLRLKIHNHYGPSETHMVVGYPLPRDPGSWPSHLPIGRPISGVSVYLFDEEGQAVGLGVVGEIYLGGRCPARGYFARPGLTAERFVPDAASTALGGRLYRTGDLSRHLGDGTLQFLGRADHQLKLRGFRIEPGEVEVVAAEHIGVERAVVTVVGDPSGDHRLVLYAVGSRGLPSTSDLRSYLRQRLPEYMVPAAIMLLDTLPLTPSGKVDRAALPEPEKEASASGVPHVAPETPLQEEVAGLWREVLEIERFGIHENFFDLGGHSLRATRLVARVRQVMGVELPVRAVFEKPTVAEMEMEITARLADGEDAEELAQMLDEIRDLSPQELEELLGDDSGT